MGDARAPRTQLRVRRVHGSPFGRCTARWFRRAGEAPSRDVGRMTQVSRDLSVHLPQRPGPQRLADVARSVGLELTPPGVLRHDGGYCADLGDPRPVEPGDIPTQVGPPDVDEPPASVLAACRWSVSVVVQGSAPADVARAVRFARELAAATRGGRGPGDGAVERGHDLPAPSCARPARRRRGVALVRPARRRTGRPRAALAGPLPHPPARRPAPPVRGHRAAGGCAPPRGTRSAAAGNTPGTRQ